MDEIRPKVQLVRPHSLPHMNATKQQLIEPCGKLELYDVGVLELDLVSDGSLAEFIPNWYGLPDRPVSTRPRPDHLPPPLVTWYRLADRWSLPLSRDHRFVPADELAADGVFWQSTDGDEAYAYLTGGDDPPVVERAGDGWLPTGLPLSRFLVYVAVYEAVYSPVHGLIKLAATPEELDAVLGRLEPLEDPLWAWPDPALRYFAGDDLLAHADVSGSGGRLVIATRHRDALTRFDGYALAWDWDSRGDSTP
jgi:hypothetical protein